MQTVVALGNKDRCRTQNRVSPAAQTLAAWPVTIEGSLAV